MRQLVYMYFVIIILHFSKCNIADSTLKLVHVFFRHGTRIPDEHEVYSNDPYGNMFKNKYGQLTNRGKNESYKLGTILRNRYHNFLGENFHLNIVLTKSTDTDRTKMTALLVLAGLFPPYNNDKWSDELNWLPIPITFEKFDKDYELIRPDLYCPKYLQEVNRLLNSEEALKVLNKYNNTLEVITNNTKQNYKTLRDVFLFHQLLTTEQNMNLVLPSWIANEYKSIQYLANMQCYFENYNTLLKKLNGGRMLTRVIKNINEKIANTLQPPERKIFLYSGHDNNIISILSSLHLYNFTFPNYNSAVFIELHQNHDSKDHYVKVYYLEDVHSQPKAQFLKDCGYWCNFEKFKEIVQPHLPSNYTLECGSHIFLD